MRPYEQLYDWTDHEVFGQFAQEILKLARQHGMPLVPFGLPYVVPIPFCVPPTTESDVVVERLKTGIGVLHHAIGLHLSWEKGTVLGYKPFEAMLEWVENPAVFVVDPKWHPFKRASQEVVDRCIDDLASCGLIQYVILSS